MKTVLTRAILACVPLMAGLAFAVPATAAPARDVFTDPPKTFPVTQGWFDGRATYYYDFGMNTPPLNGGAKVATDDIYVLVTGFDAGGNPQMLAGQHNIIDAVPGDPGYSDLWQVHLVTVPAGTAPNTIRSLDAIKQAGYPIKATPMLVNCPVVPIGSHLAEGTPGLTQGWYRGREVDYFDFGPNTDSTLPIYAFITGFDANGKPQMVAGQHNIIGVVPGQPGYSAFWDVHFVQVPAGYQANTIASVDAVMRSGYPIAHPGVVVDCPVIRTDAAPSAGHMPGMPATGAPAALPAGLMALLLAGLLVGVGAFLRRVPRRE